MGDNPVNVVPLDTEELLTMVLVFYHRIAEIERAILSGIDEGGPEARRELFAHTRKVLGRIGAKVTA